MNSRISSNENSKPFDCSIDDDDDDDCSKTLQISKRASS